MTSSGRTAAVFERLKQAASALELVDYGQLADLAGVPAVAIHVQLDAIYDYCRRHEYPEINVLAVSRAKGVPSKNLAPFGKEEQPINLQGMTYWATEMIRVFSFDWSGITYS